MLRYCFCEGGYDPWLARLSDRFCGLCGRELLAVIPRAPLLESGPPPVLIAYLQAGEGFRAGTLGFDLVGLIDGLPDVHWEHLDGARLDLLGQDRSALRALELSLWADTPHNSSAGPFGRARLTVALHEQPFDFEVRAFAVAEGHCHPRLKPGSSEQAGALLVISRDVKAATTYLEFDAGPGVPVGWGEILCDHPAVTVTPLHPGQMRAPAVARVRWDPVRLRADDEVEEVVFRLRPRALPEVLFRQRVCRRTRRPLRFQPAVLAVDMLTEDAPETRLIRLTNEDSRLLVIRRVEPRAPWMAGAVFEQRLPLALNPGESTTLQLDLHFQEVNGTPPPYEGIVGLELKGRGCLDYPVRVESVRPPRRLEGPLLIDPGPPRIVLARWDSSSRRVVYLPSSGDGGLEPEELGLARQDYAEAIYGRRPATAVLRYLIASALARCRMRDRLEPAEVRVCRHPWLPADPGLAGVELCDWTGTVAGVAERVQVGARLVRVDLRNGYLCEGPGVPAVPLLGPGESGQALGAVLLQWLTWRFAEDLRILGQRIPPALATAAGAEAPPESLWMRLTCEALALDYRWGAGYAWRRLLRSWRAALPGLGPVGFNFVEAHRWLAHCAADYARRLGAALARRGAAGGVVLVGPLLRGRVFEDVLGSMLTAAGFETECLAVSWVEGLAPW
ncbi:MAG: hypothetical protein L0Z62_16030 [Gemmataceae bacterium]|nr:hypothetical protein [Gemmataceae bacterium]